MTKLSRPSFFFILSIGLLSFNLVDTDLIEFSYPERNGTAITMKTGNLEPFKKEWRGSDYYYSGESRNGIICSVLFYKLTEEEQESLVAVPRKIVEGPELSPAYPFAYFGNYSNLKKFEKNTTIWGKPTDDFMFRQNDVPEYKGMKIKQKHMYGYSMPAHDLFVNIHLSKVNCTPQDSTEMRELLNSLAKK